MEDIVRLKAMEYNIMPIPENPALAMAYVPYQNAKKLYGVEQGISSGTMFPCLDKPFCPDCGKCGGADKWQKEKD